MSRSGGLLAIDEPCSRTERGSQEGLITSHRGLRYTGTPCCTSPNSSRGAGGTCVPCTDGGLLRPQPRPPWRAPPAAPLRYIAGAPVPPLPGGRLGDRRPRPAGTPPARVTRSSPVRCSAPIPCTSRSPQRLRHRRRRQDSLLHGAPAGKPRAHVDFSEPSPGTARAHSGMLPEYSPGTRHCTPCSSTSPGVPRRPVRRPSASAPGSTAPVPLQEVLPSPAGWSVLPRYDAPDPSHGRVLLLAQAVPPAPPAPPGPLERSSGTPSASRPPSSPPRRRSTPGPYGEHRLRSPGSSTSPGRPTPEGPWEKFLITDSIA